MRYDQVGITETVKHRLRILFLEDDPFDSELFLLELKRADLSVSSEIVRNKIEFIHSLSTNHYDLVLADYGLRGWTGMDALQWLRDEGLETPFILITGVLDDEIAVECIKRGASDYILKDRLARLPAAICHSLEEHFLRQENKRIEARLRDNEEKFRTLTETIASAILLYDGLQCQYANRAAERITEYSGEELRSMTLSHLLHPDYREIVPQIGQTRLADDVRSPRYEVQILTKSGAVKWLELTSSAITIQTKCGLVVTAFDITARKRAEDEIRYLMASDPLTGLANYRRLSEAFESEQDRSGRTGRSFAIVLCDLDRLKEINDIYGHLTGSRALCRVAEVLRRQCRSLDVPARYGGDEFLIILPETEAEDAGHFVRRVVDNIHADGEQPHLSLSFGIAMYPQDGKDFPELLGIADRKLYSMKANHRTSIAS